MAVAGVPVALAEVVVSGTALFRAVRNGTVSTAAPFGQAVSLVLWLVVAGIVVVATALTIRGSNVARITLAALLGLIAIGLLTATAQAALTDDPALVGDPLGLGRFVPLILGVWAAVASVLLITRPVRDYTEGATYG